MKQLNYIRVILVEPTHPGNIGATARAMANMGVSRLMLVRPREYPSEIANARAAGAEWILDNAQIHDNLDAAIADCTLLLGTTARPRSIQSPSLKPWDAMQKAAIHAGHGQVGILFGRESSGLTNQELDRCHHLVRIPVSENFTSLNLGSAVAIVLYELHKNLLSSNDLADQPSDQLLANVDDMRQLYQHFETVLTKIEFVGGRSKKLMRKVFRLFNRIQPYQQEIKMLRGILSAIEYKVDQTDKRDI